MDNQVARTAFPAEFEAEEILEAAEEGRGESFDSIVDDESIGDDTDDMLVQETEMLEEISLPGRTLDEAKRKSEWFKLPRPARAAIRRLR